MTAKTFYTVARADGLRSAAEMARYLGTPMAQVQLWIRLLHRDTLAKFI